MFIIILLYFYQRFALWITQEMVSVRNYHLLLMYYSHVPARGFSPAQCMNLKNICAFMFLLPFSTVPCIEEGLNKYVLTERLSKHEKYGGST